MKKQYIFIGKTVFFPEHGILAVGDLHLGFDYNLQQSGMLVPEMQIEEIKKELTEIFNEITEKKIQTKENCFHWRYKTFFFLQVEREELFQRTFELSKKLC